MSKQCKHFVFVSPFKRCIDCENEKRDETIQALINLNVKLIETLENSCTKFAGESGNEHEHTLFDNIDEKEIKNIKQQLKVLAK